MDALHRTAPPQGWELVDCRILPTVPPYRLDLTAAVLRRTDANLVDVWIDDGRYLRASASLPGPEVSVVTQAPGAGELHVATYRLQRHGAPPHQSHAPTIDLRLTLGTQVDLTEFCAAARCLPLLWPLVERSLGVKPPRYPSLWEAVCNSVIFQQVSLEAAMTVIGRLVARFSARVEFGDVPLYPFPEPGSVRDADPEALRSLGLSSAKVRSLQNAADAIVSRRIADAEIAALPTPEAVERLTGLRGIGPWTASVILLRGFGRLDVFPMSDSGARRGLRALLGDHYTGEDPDASRILEALGSWRGMLYYHLLLLRLEKRGRIQAHAGDVNTDSGPSRRAPVGRLA